MGLKDFLAFQNYCFQDSPEKKPGSSTILQHSSPIYWDHIQDLESSNYDRLKYKAGSVLMAEAFAENSSRRSSQVRGKVGVSF